MCTTLPFFNGYSGLKRVGMPWSTSFFEQSKNQAIAEQMELHIQKSERYTEYLRNNNLLIPYERPQQIQEFLKRAKALLQAGEARHGKEIEE